MARHYYCPDTGKFHNSSGKEVGSYTKKYGRIILSGKEVKLARYAVFLTTGAWPIGEVDHINGDTKDNRWCNLRVCTKADNLKNRPTYKTSKIGYKGVYFDRGKYVATIQVDGKRIYLGRDSDPAVCAVMYNEAAVKYHKEFARLNIIKEVI